MAHDWTDGRHDAASVEEWVFAAWTVDGSLGVISGHRLHRTRSWYWAALARAGRPLLHITDFDVPVRADPFILKGEAMWAEHFRDAPMEQWSVGNETYASSIDDPDEALGRAYGDPTPIAFDLEWYATRPPAPLDAGAEAAADTGVDGYHQVGVVHGAVEILGNHASTSPRSQLDSLAPMDRHKPAETAAGSRRGSPHGSTRALRLPRRHDARPRRHPRWLASSAQRLSRVARLRHEAVRALPGPEGNGSAQALVAIFVRRGAVDLTS